MGLQDTERILPCQPLSASSSTESGKLNQAYLQLAQLNISLSVHIAVDFKVATNYYVYYNNAEQNVFIIIINMLQLQEKKWDYHTIFLLWLQYSMVSLYMIPGCVERFGASLTMIQDLGSNYNEATAV